MGNGLPALKSINGHSLCDTVARQKLDGGLFYLNGGESGTQTVTASSTIFQNDVIVGGAKLSWDEEEKTLIFSFDNTVPTAE